MPSILFMNTNKEAKVRRQGETILEAAKRARVPLRHKCGGKGSCTTCKIQIEDQHSISSPGKLERRMLEDSALRNGIRLGCQAKVYGDVQVRIPEDPYKSKIQALLEMEKKKGI